jgi:hypothetical protein
MWDSRLETEAVGLGVKESSARHNGNAPALRICDAVTAG